MAPADYYQVLGVSRNAGEKEIRKAYRTLARKYHPDVCKEPGAEERFKEINQAYRVLSDPDRKAQYDRMGHDTYTSASPRILHGRRIRRGAQRWLPGRLLRIRGHL